MNQESSISVQGTHIAIPPFNPPMLPGGHYQPRNVSRNCRTGHKFCYKLDGGDRRCAWCRCRKQRCVMDTLPGLVPSRNLVLPLRMQHYFINERNNWLDSRRGIPPAELDCSDDELLSWERGIRANLGEFVPCHLKWLYEHAQEAKIVSQDSSQAAEVQPAGEPSQLANHVEEVQGTEYPPLDLHDQHIPYHRSLVVDLSAWGSEFRTEIIDGRTCLVITHNNRPSPPPSP
ncbi:hypothetical protein BDA99DRAFT_594174 [Phascolomyces articulosus]|uniref:Uncharacterized protein n=1 Tax=Phascolomyces articulosus TaxID=60185 RepID=A0AAD5JM67_9FUNG|nr:hypothetical protein BDA99DRAFT_594174 [Phascolomyces articulosus]